MIIISDIINGYYRSKLKSKSYRSKIFGAALRNELRHKKTGRIVLRNLNDLMNADTSIHTEFKELVGEEQFQAKFWESDLGYLWFEGNAGSGKLYFETAVNLLREKQLKSLLDVGCGWGIFCNKCISETTVPLVKGIDISEGVIENAKKRFVNERLQFEVKDVMLEKERYDMVTIFGSIDYVLPSQIEAFLLKMLDLANKQIVIVNSLRKMDLRESMEMPVSKEIKRYDIGYVHPLNQLLEKHQAEKKYTFSIQRSGLDSALVIIEK